MARHRNVRQLGLDDVSSYDDALASSVDDDYGISPNATEHYLYTADKRDMNSLVFFGNKDKEPLKISEDDFPVNEVANEAGSPGYITGRIKPGYVDQSQQVQQEVFEFDELNPQELILETPDDKLKTFVQEKDRGASPCLNSANGENSKFCSSEFEEMDFESLESIALGSNTCISSKKPPCKPVSVQYNQKSTIFPREYMRNLRCTSGRLTCSTVIPSPSNECFRDIVQTVSPAIISGTKRPSNLGSVMSSSPKQSRLYFEYILQRHCQVLCRCRGCTALSVIHPKYKLLKPFEFDLPEPVTFESRQKTAVMNLTAPFPASKFKPQTHASKPNATSSASRDAEPVRLAETLAHKLDLTDQSRDLSTPMKMMASSNSLIASPSKPIDRKPLLIEYQDRCKQEKDKEIINLIVLGHVDAGKSTLMGNLLCQLGNVSSKQLSKYKWEAQKVGKASFAYAWVLDQTSEERNRGVTMDIAQTSFETKTKRIALMDAPGHKDFVPRVIGGASQADAAVLVVNATNGEFETGFGPGGQTREHARLARLLGVSRLIVAVNKMDTVNWSQARFDQIQSQLSHFLKGMNITAVDFCPVSGLTGVNLVSKSAAKTEKYSEGEVGAALFTWYHGPCLLDIIDSIPSPDRTVDGPFRFVVSDIFKPAGLGVPAVAGRVLSGGVSSGLNAALSRVFCQPSGLPATVKSIRSLCTVRSGSDHTEGAEISGGFLDQVVKSAFSGDQVALILNGIDPFQSLVPGDVIADPDNPVPLASRISAKVLVFTVPQPITQGYPVIFYYHCTSIGAHITRLKSMTHKENKVMKTVKKPRCLLGNCTADVEITLERPVCLEVYERCKPLGRFMLRVNGESVAGGTVTAVLPSKKNRLVDF